MNNLWQSDRAELDKRNKACNGCDGRQCKSPFYCYKLIVVPSETRTKIYNVHCQYYDDLKDNEKAKERWAKFYKES